MASATEHRHGEPRRHRPSRSGRCRSGTRAGGSPPSCIAVLAAMFVHMLVTNSARSSGGSWSTTCSPPPVLRGVRTTLIMTVLAMVIGVLLGIVLAVLRLSPNPVLSGAAWVYVWFFRAIPRSCCCSSSANLGALYGTYTLGVPFGGQLMQRCSG